MGKFLKAVFSHWEPLVSGFFFTLFLGVISWLYAQRPGSDTVPWYYYVFVALIFLFYACYRTWLGQQQKITELESDIKNLAGQIPSPEQQELSNAIEKDRTSVEMMVRVLKCTVSLQLNTSPAYLGLEFLVFNGSIHSILLNTIGGFILYDGKKLEGKIIFSTKWRRESIPHGYVAFIEIFQYLTNEEVEIIRHDQTKNPRERSNCRFVLNNLDIAITGGTNAERVIPKPLSLYGFSEITLDRTIIG